MFQILQPHMLLWLFFAAILASFVDAIAGGGGLITLPALLLTGMDPVWALGTNKLQSSFSSVSATYAFARRGLMDMRLAPKIVLVVFPSAVFGACCASWVDKTWFKNMVPILLVFVAIYFAFSPHLQKDERAAKMSMALFLALVLTALGFYDGIFGPGVGSFLMLAFTSLMGFSLFRSMAHTKLCNATSNLGALAVFAWQGKVMVFAALCMAVGAIMGSQLGAYCAMRFGARLVKPLLIFICLCMAAKLFFW